MIIIQMAQLVPLKSHFQPKKGVLMKTPTKIILFCLLPATPVSLCVYGIEIKSERGGGPENL